MVLKPYLQLSRAHTAPLETVPAFIGALLATGEVNLLVAGWGLFGFMYHIAGYTHNSVVDYLNGHDKDDPHKSHHPLNSRGWEFSFGAQVLSVTLIILTVLMLVAMMALSPEGLMSTQILSLGTMAVICALFYNHYSKGMSSKAVPITIAHSLVFVIPYLSMGGETNAPFYFLTLFMVTWIFFQIGISGEIKDITTDENNFLLDSGVRVTEIPTVGCDYYIEMGDANKMAAGLTLGKITSAFVVMIELGGTSYIHIGAFVALSMALMGFGMSMMRTGEYKRNRRVQDMSLIEAVTLAMFCLATSPLYGEALGFIIVVASVLWVAVLNMAEWGTWTTPRV